MLVILPILLVLVFGWAWFERKRSGLSRVCRWRQERSAGQWRCAVCKAVQPGNLRPVRCRARA